MSAGRRGGRWLSTPTVVAGALAAVAFGGLMELAQYFIPERRGTVGDFLLNSVGVGVAALCVSLRVHSRRALRMSGSVVLEDSAFGPATA